jgi:hypothetical protein
MQLFQHCRRLLPHQFWFGCVVCLLCLGCQNNYRTNNDPYALGRTTIPPPGTLPSVASSTPPMGPNPNLGPTGYPMQPPNAMGYPVSNNGNPNVPNGWPSGSSIFQPNMPPPQANTWNNGSSSVFEQPPPANNSWMGYGAPNNNVAMNPNYGNMPGSSPRLYQSDWSGFDSAMPNTSRNPSSLAWGGNTGSGTGFWNWLTGPSNPAPMPNTYGQPMPPPNNQLALDPRSPMYQGQRTWDSQTAAMGNPMQPSSNSFVAAPGGGAPGTTNWNITPPPTNMANGANLATRPPNYTTFGTNTPGTPSRTLPASWPTPGAPTSVAPVNPASSSRITNFEDLPAAR